MTRLQLLTFDLRRRLKTHSTTLTRIAARELAGELRCLDGILTELDDFVDRLEIIEARLELLEQPALLRLQA